MQQLTPHRNKKPTLLFLVGFLFILFGGSQVIAKRIFEVGETYHLNRVKYPGEIAVCVTEQAMMDYMEAIWAKNTTRVKELLHAIKSNDDIHALTALEGCTLVNSFSQAKIIKKSAEVYQAEFFAFPFLPMWGWWEYFGAPVP